MTKVDDYREPKPGMRVKINNWFAVILKIEGHLALLKTDSGSQFCYGVHGIKQSNIIAETEPQPEPGTQLETLYLKKD